MKIEGPSKPSAIEAVRQVVSKRIEPQPRLAKDDSVRFSGEARTLLDARSPERPDRAKIQALREQIRSGTFRPDPERIADAMIAEEC